MKKSLVGRRVEIQDGSTFRGERGVVVRKGHRRAEFPRRAVWLVSRDGRPAPLWFYRSELRVLPEKKARKQ